jgi:saccharopine dehydrogenase-like NADP-dependent oxidoreductase
MVTIHCLGSGLVGSFVIKKLSTLGVKINVVDIEETNFLTNNDLIKIYVKDAVLYCEETFDEGDLFINMLPGNLGHSVTKLLVSKGERIVDLSFSEETPEILHEIALESGSRLLWDVGIAPGLSNMLISYASRVGGGIINAEIRVGGNPIEKDDEWSYMAPFSPNDVIAEYTRPARIIRDRKICILPALSERHKINVKQTGNMEAFLTDGLRSLIDTIPADDMTEYTVRWPGHIQRFIDERKAKNLDLESLVKMWKFDGNRREFTWMEIKVDCKNGEKMRWTVYDEGLNGDSSMARTTGLVTFSCIKQWLIDENLIDTGVYPPENLPNEVILNVLQYLKDEGVTIEGPDINL